MNNKVNKFFFSTRFVPALFMILPIVIVSNYIVLIFGYELALMFTLTDSLFVILLLVLSYFIRHKGNIYHNKMSVEWDGLPTTRFLRLSNNEIDVEKKSHFRSNLKSLFPDLYMPSLDDEIKDKKNSDLKYELFVTELREATRDKVTFEIINHENAMYCFIRNLRSIKWVSLIISAFCLLPIILLTIFLPDKFLWTPTIVLSSIVFVDLFVWLLFVRKTFVKEAAEKYALALLNSSNILVKR